MTAAQTLQLMHGNAHRRLRAEVAELTPEQLGWSSRNDVNTIGFLLWHVGRVEDMKVARLLGEGWKTGEPLVIEGKPALGNDSNEVWLWGGWAERFGWKTGGYGFGFSHEQAHQFPVSDRELLLGYFDAVTVAGQKYLGGIADDRAESAVQIGLITHTVGHLGAIQYIKGLQGVGSGQGT